MSAREPIEHDLKVHPAPFAAVQDGSKTFEFRRADRDYQAGDTVCLREWCPETEGFPAHYSGPWSRRRITYVMREGFGLPAGYCIFSIVDITP